MPPAEAVKAAAPYSMGAMFRRLENGQLALTGRTGDAWDVSQAPTWRSQSKILDPLLIQAGNVVGSLAFATNIAANAGGRIFQDIPNSLLDAPALIDEQLKKTIGIDSDELSLLAASATPTFPLDDLAAIALVQAKNLSKATKLRLLGPELRISDKARAHIRRRHVWMELPIDRSLFFPHIDTDLLVEKARRIPPVLQSNGNYVRVAHAKEYVGLDMVTRRPTKVYTVVTDYSDNVITEHPGLPDPKYSPDQ
ncbi:MAG TPA: hypothetical protein VJP40_08180 [bacterium]|nr:hypothetical protein [bacterium]